MITLSTPYTVADHEMTYGEATAIEILQQNNNAQGHFASVGFVNADGNIFASRLLQFKEAPGEQDILAALKIEAPAAPIIEAPAPTAKAKKNDAPAPAEVPAS